MKMKWWKFCIVIALLAGFAYTGKSVKGQETYWMIHMETSENPVYFLNGTGVEIELVKGVRPKEIKIFVNRRQEEILWEENKTVVYFQEEGRYQLTVEHKNGIREHRVIVIEIENPTVPNISCGTYKPGKWTAQDVRIQGWGSKAVSGISKYEYKIGNEKWKEMNDEGLKIKESLEEIIQVRAVSKAGRQGDIQQIPVKVWKEKPSRARIVYNQPDQNGWYQKIPKIQVVYPKEEGPEVTTYFTMYYMDKKEIITRKNEIPPILEEGSYQLETWSVDEAGNRSEKSGKYTWKIDSTAPKIQWNYEKAFPCGQKSIKNQKIQVTVRDKNITEKSIQMTTSGRWSGQWIRRGGGYTTEVSFQKEGKQDFTIQCKDDAGNKGRQKAASFFIDRTSPEITVKGVENHKVYTGKVSLEIVIKDTCLDRSKTKILLNKKEWKGGIIEKDGHYILSVEGGDNAGNYSKKEYRFTINQRGIRIEFLQENLQNVPTNQKKLKLAFLIESMDPVRIQRFRINGTEVSYVWRKNVVWMKSSLRKDGIYNVELAVVDAGGNHTKVDNIKIVYDTKAPDVVIEGIKNQDKIQYGSTIEISLLNQKDRLQFVKLDGADLTVKSKRIQIEKLDPGIHSIYIKAKDAAGNFTEKKLSFEVEKIWPQITKTKVKEQLKEKSNWGVVVLGISGMIAIIFIRNIKKKASRL